MWGGCYLVNRISTKVIFFVILINCKVCLYIINFRVCLYIIGHFFFQTSEWDSDVEDMVNPKHVPVSFVLFVLYIFYKYNHYHMKRLYFTLYYFPLIQCQNIFCLIKKIN